MAASLSSPPVLQFLPWSFPKYSSYPTRFTMEAAFALMCAKGIADTVLKLLFLVRFDVFKEDGRLDDEELLALLAWAIGSLSVLRTLMRHTLYWQSIKIAKHLEAEGLEAEGSHCDTAAKVHNPRGQGIRISQYFYKGDRDTSCKDAEINPVLVRQMEIADRERRKVMREQRVGVVSRLKLGFDARRSTASIGRNMSIFLRRECNVHASAGSRRRLYATESNPPDLTLRSPSPKIVRKRHAQRVRFAASSPVPREAQLSEFSSSAGASGAVDEEACRSCSD